MSPKPKKWVLILPVVIGIAGFVLLKQNQTQPVREALSEQPKLVRVIEAPLVTVIPGATGHGTVAPARTWGAVAQVGGRIVEKHPQLARGSILEADTLVLQIDPTDYELAIAQTEADIQAIHAQLDEQEMRTENGRKSLAIEQAALELNAKELERKRALVGKGGVSRSDLEDQERSLLGQQQSVQAQQNSLNLIPSQKALLMAQLAQQQAKLAAARRNLEHTSVRLPFTGRIAEVNVELDQYVREGEVLTIADDLEMAEVESQIPIEQIGGLLRSNPATDGVTTPFKLSRAGFGLKAEVRLREAGISATWQARVARLSDTLDPKTRTLGVFVEVEKPYVGVKPGVRPPLIKGLFVEVTLTGAPRPDSLVIPRHALHDDKVYLVDGQNRLEIRAVEPMLLQPGFVVLSKGLSGGERIVVSDLVPAIEGMLLEPTVDEPLLKGLLLQAGGGSRE
ncbi:MAG: HlyD family efflux transporter periplasmic adaptor subunit [Gammaproteobacteria bacterium]|nr:HlyD family efflux transporter periplasmic adaptor subunit [Gammaproteobacteria bacterium]